METHEIGLPHQFIDFTPSKVGPVGNRASYLIGSKYAHLECHCYLGYAPSNLTQAHYSDRLSCQLDQGHFPEGEILGSRPLSSAARLAVKGHVMAQLQDQREHKFRDRCGPVGRDIADYDLELAGRFYVDDIVAGGYDADGAG